MILWLAVALAVDAGIVPERGPIRAGRDVVLLMAAADELHQPVPILGISASAGRLHRLPSPDEAAPVRALWAPPSEPGEVRFELKTAAGTVTRIVQVGPDEPSTIRLPERVDAVDGRPLSLRIDSDTPLDPATVRVHVSEPAEVSIVPDDGGARLDLKLGGEGARTALVSVVVHGQRPAFATSRVSIIARPTLSFDLEPRARLTVRIGGRTYGPARPGPEGTARLTIDQRPGETTAELTVADELGNALTSPYVLSARSPGPVVIAPLGPALGPDLPPELLVLAARPSGAWLVAPAPTCRAGGEALPTRVVGQGAWRIELPRSALPPDGLRVQCEAPEGKGEAVIARPAGRPASIALSVWPDTVDTDAPRAEVAAYVLDDRGVRLAEPRPDLRARHGTFEPASPTGPGSRGFYLANEAASRIGVDVLTASVDLPRGESSPSLIEVGLGTGRDGAATIVAIPRDASGRAIPDLPLRVGLEGREHEVQTDENGKAIVREADAPPILVATAQAGPGALTWGAIAVREGPWTGPRIDDPDIIAEARLPVLRGRVTVIRVEPEERLVLSGEGAATGIRIDLFDRQGGRVENVAPVLEASTGKIEAPEPQPDGSWRAVLRPPADGRSRVIEVLAASPSGEAEASVEVRVEPRPLVLAAGLGVGASTNLGKLSTPVLSIDVDVGLPGRIRGAMARIGVSTLSYSSTANTEFGEVRNQMTLVPIALAALIRRRMGVFSFHGGGGVSIVPFRAETRFNNVRRPPRGGLTPPGFVGTLGAGRRIGAGELSFEARLNLIYSQGTVSGFAGQIGGIGGLLSYRLLID